MSSLDYPKARSLLDATFERAQAALLSRTPPQVNAEIVPDGDMLFSSKTQAYREVLLGCTVARILDKNINIRQPYVDQGPNSFSGRSLDERVVNPFLQDKRIPSSRGPYLSVFRRSVRFDKKTGAGLRDKKGYHSFLSILKYLENVSEDEQLSSVLIYLLYKFAELRESSVVQLSQLQRISLQQYDVLISGLLSIKSGGRFPVLLIIATLRAIKDFFGLDWSVEHLGINVADTAAGVVGDITVKSANQTVLAAEITERVLDRSRVVATFNTKIAPSGIEDYLFFVRSPGVDPKIRQQAHQYFAQGHEVNVLVIQEWMHMVLATVGKRGRTIFSAKLRELLEAPDVPKSLKVAWNDQVAKLMSKGQPRERR